MKYVVKCHYCGHSYIVDAREDEEDFQCDTCGGQNSIEDVVERINDPIIVEKEVIKKVVVKEKEDSDLQTIKNYDDSKYKVDDDIFVSTGSSEEKTMSAGMSLIVVVIAIIFCVIVFNMPEQETEQERIRREVQELMEEREADAAESYEAILAKKTINQWMQAMNDKDAAALLSCYDVPEGTIFDEYDLREMVKSSELEDLWGNDVQIRSISFDSYAPTSYMLGVDMIRYTVEFSNDYSTRFTVDKTDSGSMKIRLEDADVASDVKVRTARNSTLYIDDTRIDSPYEEVEDEEGQKYSEYTIPLMREGRHVFEVSTILGVQSMMIEVEEDEQVVVLDALQVGIGFRNEMETELMDIWKQVQTAALNYAEPSEFRQFFHERITDEEIEELAKQIRMEQDLRGNYEGASITDVKVSDTYFCAIDYYTFIISTDVAYQSLNENHPSGTCTGKIAITAYEGGWQIYENYDNSFFTLVEGDS